MYTEVAGWFVDFYIVAMIFKAIEAANNILSIEAVNYILSIEAVNYNILSIEATNLQYSFHWGY